MPKTRTLPERTELCAEDTWDLAALFPNDDAWEASLREYEQGIAGYKKYRGKLGRDARTLAACLDFDCRMDRLSERLGAYAFLKSAEDRANSRYQAMVARYQNVATRAAEAASFLRPEILAIRPAAMKTLLEDRRLKPYRLLLQRVLRFRKHTLSKREEALLAMQGEMADAARKAFQQLHDADLKFGFVTNEKGERVELGNATFMGLLMSPKRSVRRTAFHKYYEPFQAHRNTLAATLNGSIQKDVYYARARGYASSLEAALFPDNVPPSVYDNLIATVRRHLPAVHRYYEVRRRKMRLREIHHYDTYVPILSDRVTRRTWKQAVALVIKAMAPLGDPYVSQLAAGLEGSWCDRYPNRGKHSGAFSLGVYDSHPFILMNYKPEVPEEVFTLAHEAGHAMHSLYSARHQPFPYYDYSIFVAEVASTFNEQLLARYLMDHARSHRERAVVINRQIDAMRATIVRQTMFAEFEKITHEMAETGEPLTAESFQDVYGRLLEDYFGPDFALDEALRLECFRIPHFYRAFYVYKYATGLSAAIALSQRVLEGGRRERNDYLGFLKAGCSKDPLDLLRDAGVDMESPEPIETALAHFDRLVTELDELI